MTAVTALRTPITLVGVLSFSFGSFLFRLTNIHKD